MAEETYELLALTARYWFMILVALIVIRGWRWSVSINRNARLLRDWVGSTGSVGELVVLEDGRRSKKRTLCGVRFPVGVEGLIGSSSVADIRIHHPDVRRRHVWMTYQKGHMVLTPQGRAQITCPRAQDGRYILRDGDEVVMGKLKMMLVFYDVQDAVRESTPKRKNVTPPPAEEEYEDISIEENFWE